jgi:hypothetical protein
MVVLRRARGVGTDKTNEKKKKKTKRFETKQKKTTRQHTREKE